MSVSVQLPSGFCSAASSSAPSRTASLTLDQLDAIAEINAIDALFEDATLFSRLAEASSDKADKEYLKDLGRVFWGIHAAPDKAWREQSQKTASCLSAKRMERLLQNRSNFSSKSVNALQMMQDIKRMKCLERILSAR